MVIIKKDEYCPECGAEIKSDEYTTAIVCGKKLTRCPECGHIVNTGKILYDDYPESERKRIDSSNFKPARNAAIIFVISLILFLVLKKGYFLWYSMMGIMVLELVYFFTNLGTYLGEKAQTLKRYNDGKDKELYKAEKSLSDKIKKEGYRIVYKFNEKEYFHCDECGEPVVLNERECSKCGASYDKDLIKVLDKDVYVEEDKEDNEYTFNCDHCGAEVKENAKKCPKCGAIFVDEDDEDEVEENEIEDEDEEELDTFTCDNCGAEVKENAKKCPKCGAIFEDDDDEEEDEDEEDEIQTIEEDEVEENEIEEEDEFFTCENCGAKVKEDANKCPKCGAIFEEDEDEDEEDDFDEEIQTIEDDEEEIEEEVEEDNKSNTSIDDKYDSLVKLKDLLDKDIITKEEFDKEKKKILK